MGNGGGNPHISADAVISKLKDDGDFDKLRHKIIRHLKQNEDLRNTIISSVKQSAVLNRPGCENIKPRQLSDAIHKELGETVMNHISDCVWDIIRSGDGMKTEITETVQSVYSKLLNPEGNVVVQSSSQNDLMPVQRGLITNGCTAPPSELDLPSSHNEPDEPPGFALHEPHHNEKMDLVEQQNNDLEISTPGDGVQKDHNVEAHRVKMIDFDNVELNTQPDVSAMVEYNRPYDDNDEDPDVPPGFG